MKMLIVRFNMFFWHDTTLQTDLSWWTDIFPRTTGYVIMHSNTNFTGHQFSIWNYFKKKKTYLPNSDMIQQIVLLQSTVFINNSILFHKRFCRVGIAYWVVIFVRLPLIPMILNSCHLWFYSFFNSINTVCLISYSTHFFKLYMLTFQCIEIMFLLSGEINLISRPWPQRWELQGPLSVAEAPQHWKQLVTSFFGLTKSSPQTLLLPSVVREFKSAHVYERNIGRLRQLFVIFIIRDLHNYIQF